VAIAATRWRTKMTRAGLALTGASRPSLPVGEKSVESRGKGISGVRVCFTRWRQTPRWEPARCMVALSRWERHRTRVYWESGPGVRRAMRGIGSEEPCALNAALSARKRRTRKSGAQMAWLRSGCVGRRNGKPKIDIGQSFGEAARSKR